MNEKPKINYEKINGIFFFADLIDSLECANYLTAEDYNELLCLYQNHFWRIVSNLDVYAQFMDIRSAEINVSGDGVSFFFPGPENIGSLISLAIDLKTTWLLSDFNINRIEDGKLPIDISIGLNMGPIMRGPRSGWSKNDGWIDNFKIGMEGFPISIAKRFENFGREGYFSRIIVGQPILDYCIEKAFPDQFHSHGLIKIKGLSQGIPAYELKTCWNSPLSVLHFDNNEEFFNKVKKIVRTNPKNPWYYLWISDLLSYHRKYNEAESYIKLALKFDTDNAQAFSLLCEAALWNEDYNLAKSHLLKSVKVGGVGFHEYAKFAIAYDGGNRFRGFDLIS